MMILIAPVLLHDLQIICNKAQGECVRHNADRVIDIRVKKTHPLEATAGVEAARC